MRSRLRPRNLLKALASTAVVGLTAAALTVGGPVGAASAASGDSATSGTVNWWGWTPTDSKTAQVYINAFNKKYPKIKVKYKVITIANYEAAMRPALASGSGPDVFDIQPGAYVTEFGSFATDLTSVAKSGLGAKWKSKIAPIGVSSLTKNGKLDALSVGSTYAGMLWINKGMFDAAGLSAPTTLADWVKDCQVFKSKGEGCFVQGAAQEGFDQDTLQSIANSVQPGLWTRMSKGKAKWSSPGMVKTLSIWKQMFSNGIMQPGAIGYQQYPDANNAFLTGKYAMVMMGTWYTQYATQAGMTAAQSSAGVSGAKPFPILPIAFPDVAGAGHTSAMYGDSDYGLAVSNKSKHAKAAKTFVKWMTTSKAGQQVVADQLDDFPSLKTTQPNFGTIQLVDPATQKAPVQSLVQKVGGVTEPREALLGTDVQTAILAAASSVATGKASPAAAAATLQQAAVAAKSAS